ncbi:hypothetical protein [Muricauda brasiliensis]|uniref:hypothetical protein n=1 Tax=Muricauda brasiliensis TaxID=2162892 RepID=UPI000D351278|nr:hypothetical protein [Muricauda brasiliensis]
MKNSIKVFGLFALFLILFSCSSSDGENSPDVIPTGEPIEFTGEWSAEKAVFDIEFEDLTETADFIAEGGSINLNVEENGSFSIQFVLGQNSESITGQMSINDDLLTIVFDYSLSDRSYFEVHHTDNILEIDGGPLEYDFDDDGTPEPALVSFRFISNQ